MNYPIYAEGFYRALHKVNEIGVPIYVTENGVADKKDDFRSEFISKYLYAMHKALKEAAVAACRAVAAEQLPQSSSCKAATYDCSTLLPSKLSSAPVCFSSDNERRCYFSKEISCSF